MTSRFNCFYQSIALHSNTLRRTHTSGCMCSSAMSLDPQLASAPEAMVGFCSSEFSVFGLDRLVAV